MSPRVTERVELPDGTFMEGPILGHQMPRLWNIPERHQEQVADCVMCQVEALEEKHGHGCGDHISEEVLDWAEQFGYILDPWQKWALRHMFGRKPNGLWAAPDVVMIVARQHGKGTVLEVRELAGVFLLEEELIIHTSHQLKDLDVVTPILTANKGWSTMGELVTGDEVYAPDGKPAPLVAHPWLTDSTCYKVHLSDGQEFVAGAEHLWEVTEVSQWNYKTSRKIVTTEHMYREGVVWESPCKDRVKRTQRWRLDLPEAFQAPDAELPVDPWLLGEWLGDGTSVNGNLSVGSQDLKYVTDRLTALGEDIRLTQDLRTGCWTVVVYGLKVRLRELGVLGNKHIPELYATASESQRRELLAGLMDSDGTVSGKGSGAQLVISQKRAVLAEQICSLARGLGYRATLNSHAAKLNGMKAGTAWVVQFKPNGTSPFGMPRKTVKAPVGLKKTRSAYNSVVSIEPVETRPTRCITVAHPSGCYLAGRGFTVTHNTSLNHLERLANTIRSYPALERKVSNIVTGNGKEAIKLKPRRVLIFGPGGKEMTGRRTSKIEFHARSGSATSRGFSCDCLVYDEAMILSNEQVGASMPTMRARPNPQMIYAASAGLEDGTVSQQLALMRRSMLNHNPDTFGLEFSINPHDDSCPRDELKGRESNYYIVCDKHDDRDDPRSWAKAGPALGTRITLATNRRELNNMPPAKFDIEILSVGNWPMDEEPWEVISKPAWKILTNEDPGYPVQPSVLSVDVSEDGKSATIMGAWSHKQGKYVLEMPRDGHRPGTDWVIPKLDELWKRIKPMYIAVPKSGPAAGLLADCVNKWGDRVYQVGPGEEAAAFAYLMQQVEAQGIWHFGEELARTLWKSVGRATTRVVGDGGKAWMRRGADTDISPITAGTLSLYVLNLKYRNRDLSNTVA